MQPTSFISESFLPKALLSSIESSLLANPGKKLLIRVSASGKNADLFDTLLSLFIAGNQQETLELFEKIRALINRLVSLLPLNEQVLGKERLKTIFTELEWMLYDEPVNHSTYYKAQIHCFESLICSAYLAVWLEAGGIRNNWLDARDFVKTDENFSGAGILADLSKSKFLQVLARSDVQEIVLITQLGIGSTEDNESTLINHWGEMETAISANPGFVLHTIENPIIFRPE